MFGALFGFTGQPVATLVPRELPAGIVDVTTLGRSGEVALVHDRRPSDAGLLDRAHLEKLDGRLWLLGEARLDGTEALRAALRSAGAGQAAGASPTMLCLLAYERWGEPCVERLAGDFAFVIWDDARRSLFAARDQMGKRCLFHARDGETGVIGNSLDWVAALGAPALVPDDYWIADFLTMSSSREAHRTAWRDVSRLPPAHALRWSAAGAACRRYWHLELAEPLQLKRPGDYLDRFRALLVEAVADRMPAGTVGIAMSGGLDSTSLAACAVRAGGSPGRVVAYCEHYERIMHIDEDRFATLAARHLGIDLEIVPFDDRAYDPHWQSRGIRSAEPTTLVVNAHCLKAVGDPLAGRATVWFEGEGPDNALSFERDPYLGWLLRRHDWSRLARALLSYAAVKGVRGWVETLRRHATPAEPAAQGMEIPRWIAPDLAGRLHLQERIDDLGEGGDRSHPWHPRAFALFTSPIWQGHFADFAFLESLSALEWRHPFIDLRVLQFLLSVPPVPWAWNKMLVREAMRGSLPAEVLERPKTPLPEFPIVASLARHGAPNLLDPTGSAAYVDARQLPLPTHAPADLAMSMNAYVIDHWLTTRPTLGMRGVTSK